MVTAGMGLVQCCGTAKAALPSVPGQGTLQGTSLLLGVARLAENFL